VALLSQQRHFYNLVLCKLVEDCDVACQKPLPLPSPLKFGVIIELGNRLTNVDKTGKVAKPRVFVLDCPLDPHPFINDRNCDFLSKWNVQLFL